MGLNTTPVISAVGPDHQNGIYGQSHDALGQMSISPNGSKVALALCYSAMFQTYDFDINTGVLSNPVSFGNFSFAWGIDFSPNSQLVYFTRWTQHKVYQADISSGVSSTIDSSIVEIGTVPGAGQYSVGYVSRTPDNRIFIAKYGYDDLATISNPNLAGVACGYNDAGVLLQYGSSTAGLSVSAVFPLNASAIKEVNDLSIKVIPNPNNGHFTVMKNKVNTQSQMLVYSINGSLVFSSKLDDTKLSETFELDLDAGVYFVSINNANAELLNQKIVILD
jgi:hypothetical protein